ncbi:MAG: hypothetical protein ACLUSP_06400 [Christensenellales bacterium]
MLSEQYALVPYSEYGETHPEWYYDEGKELRYTDGITDADEFDPDDTGSLAYNLVEICKRKSSKTRPRVILCSDSRTTTHGTTARTQKQARRATARNRAPLWCL